MLVRCGRLKTLLTSWEATKKCAPYRLGLCACPVIGPLKKTEIRPPPQPTQKNGTLLERMVVQGGLWMAGGTWFPEHGGSIIGLPSEIQHKGRRFG